MGNIICPNCGGTNAFDVIHGIYCHDCPLDDNDDTFFIEIEEELIDYEDE